MKNIICIIAVCVFPCLVKAQLPQYQGAYNPQQNLQEYFAESNANYNKSIIYVFFNNSACYGCPEAMALLEQIYQQYYSGVYGYFEINYANDDAYQFSIDYDLMTPLSIVLVKINDGMARGYLKIDNPQFWAADPQFFEQQLTTKINNFFN